MNAFSESLAARLLHDRRDQPFLILIAKLSFLIVPLAGYLYTLENIPSWLEILYLILIIPVYLGPFVLMLHNSGHRPFLKKEGRLIQPWVDWVLSPLFGQTPFTYRAHHLGMHHVEENLWDDLSSTLPYRRDCATDFAKYAIRFGIFGVPTLIAYLWKKKRMKLFKSALLGEASYFLVVGLLAYANPEATLIVFLIPLVLARFLMIAGNWAQHAFVDPAAPENPYRSSITCIETYYNQRCYNDGYHIGHHLKSSRHWSEMPAEFAENRATYAAEGAIIFTGLDYFAIWVCLMLRRFHFLSGHVVQLGDRPLKRSELIDLLRARTRPVPQTPETDSPTTPGLRRSKLPGFGNKKARLESNRAS